MADDKSDIVLASTTEADQEVLERALQDDESKARVSIFDHGSLNNFSSLEDGKVKELAYEHPTNSSRHRYQRQLEAAEKELAELAIKEDPPETVEARAKEETESRLQELERRTSAPIETQPRYEQPAPGMVPASQVAHLVESNLVVREHNQRMQAALQNPEFAAAMSKIDPNVDVPWANEIGLSVAAAHNSPALVWFLGSRPDVARSIASMPTARGVAEVARLSAWLQTEMQPQNASVRRTAPAPIPPPMTPVSGSAVSVPRNSADPSTMTFSEYKRWRRETGRR
jgi:hypothetical protein